MSFETPQFDADRAALLVAELRRQVANYEARYGRLATEAHAAIDRGELEETVDVCRWLIADDQLKRIDRVRL